MNAAETAATSTSERPASVVHAELTRLTEQKATGRLRIGDQGAIFLSEGAVAFAESTRTTSLEALLTATGKVDVRTWRRARSDGAPPHVALLDEGRLTLAEFETFVVLSVFDAAYALLTSSHAPAFVPEPAHWLTSVWRTPADLLVRETELRRARLDAVWPSPEADEAPVMPVRRMRRQRVILTGLQAEVLLNADDRRTPAELARDLGRTRYGCLLAVRGLAASGLLKTPPVPRSTTRSRRRAAAPTTRHTTGDQQPQEGSPGAALWTGIDEGLLVRLHDGLRDLV